MKMGGYFSNIKDFLKCIFNKGSKHAFLCTTSVC